MIKYSALIPNESKLNVNLSAGDMFDRIINLKINCLRPETLERESFVIRSDYEMVYPDSTTPLDGTLHPSMAGGCFIRRCSQKPSIKVQYKLVSSNTGISVNVFISNFFILTNDGKHLRSFNNSQYVIESVEIAMGYWGQFKTPPANAKDFFNIKAENGADKITLTGAIVVSTDKLPPDSQLHIEGYVGDIYSSPIAVSNIKTVDDALSNPVTSSSKDFAGVCYDTITKRYLNKHYFTDGEGANLPTGRRNIAISDIADYPVPVAFDKKTGLMNDNEAMKYGVKVFLSDKVKELKIPKVKDSSENEKNKIAYFEAGWTIGQTIARLLTFIGGELNYTFNRDGNVLIYSMEEVTAPEKLYEAFSKDKMYSDTPLTNRALYDNKLPAVNNITIDSVATIVCPFFTFLEPFQYLEFASRYALTSAVSYFASYSPTIYRFLVISASISFATVDDVNEVQITAVATKEYKND